MPEILTVTSAITTHILCLNKHCPRQLPGVLSKGERIMSYETISIRGYGWKISIAPAYGANPVSVQYLGRDVLVPWSKDIQDPFIIGAPLLLPSNRTADGRFTFEGKEYRLPINDSFQCANLHGSLYHQTFQVLEQKESYVTLCYENNGDVFPFRFRIFVSYRAEESGFTSEYAIENLEGSAMPISFGLHTSFREPDFFSVPLESCQEKDSRHIPTGSYISLTEQEEGYCMGSASKDVVISGFYRASGDTAQIGDFWYQVTGFDHWILYNGRGQGGFLCIEPQLGGVNVLNAGTNCPVILAGETLHLKTCITYYKYV